MPKGVYNRTEKQLEILKNCSKVYGFQKGNIPFFKGKTKETDEKLLKRSEKNREESLKQWTALSADEKNNLCNKLKESRRNFLNSAKGSEWRLEHSKRHKEWANTPEGKEAAKKGYLARCKRFSINGEGYFFNTPSEIEMKRCLKENGTEYVFQYFVENIKHAYYADFYLPLYNTIIEVDGRIHNFKRDKDEIRTQELEEVGYRLLRFENGGFDAQTVWREI